jgi:GNAT superfamily N-acetyltransferase
VSIIEERRGEFLISTDKAKLNLETIHDFIANRSYWAQGRPIEVVKRSVENSLCFGVYDGSRQIGVARVVTDYATFAWLCDVFVDEQYRGRGLSKWLVEVIVRHPQMQGLKRFMLATRDAHELYARYGGFEPLKDPEKWMSRPTQ